jgi:hypothetical protein
MEPVQTAAETVLQQLQDKHPQKSSKIDRGVEPARATDEQVQAMIDVLDRWRLNLGWKPWDFKTASMAAASWIASLNRQKVPAKAYMELYERSLEFRARALENGKQLPDMGSELLLSQWPMLEKEIREKEIASKSMLPETAESKCPRCLGTGLETTYSLTGIRLGAGKRCDHRPLVEGEWLYQQREKGLV